MQKLIVRKTFLLCIISKQTNFTKYVLARELRSGLVFTQTINALSTAIHYPLPTPHQTITSDFLSKVLSYHIERIFTFQYDSFNKVVKFYSSNLFVLRLTSENKGQKGNSKQKLQIPKEKMFWLFIFCLEWTSFWKC